MTQQDDITQRVLTDDELDAIHAPMQNYAACNINIFTYIARAIESALLSKLRAPVADLRPHLEWALRRIRTSLDTGDKYEAAQVALDAAMAVPVASAPVAGEAKNYPGDNVAERLDKMADDQPPGSQAQSDLYAAATIWRKHIAHRAAPQASAVAGEADNTDYIGLALELESAAKRVESQTVQRAIEAGAHGLRLAHSFRHAAPQASECECSRKSKAVSDSEAQL